MQDMAEVSGEILDSWHHVRVQLKCLRPAVDWAEQTQGGRFYWTLSGNFWFESLEDQVQFSLTWPCYDRMNKGRTVHVS
jgi:hypothetical protein